MGALFVVVPVTLWAVNVARCRTVLSGRGIELHRMVRRQWRPWPVTRSGFSVSARLFNNENGTRDFERYRLVLNNGTPDDTIRMPGGVFGGTFRWRGEKAGDQARQALDAIWRFAVEQGWPPDPRTVAVDPLLARAPAVGRAAVTGREPMLVYRAPAWHRLWEFACDSGIAPLLFGVLLTVTAVSMLVEPEGFWHAVVGVLGLLFGVVCILFALGEATLSFSRTVVDRTGIKVDRKTTIAWPTSRSSLFVAGARVLVAGPDGKAVPLPGTGGARGGFEQRERLAAAQCEEIWCWGVANGVTSEDGCYVRLDSAPMQREREVFERRSGMTAPR